MKILIFVGKGGVGKSTNSALFSVQLAAGGKRVFLNNASFIDKQADFIVNNLQSKKDAAEGGLFAEEVESLEKFILRKFSSVPREAAIMLPQAESG